MGLGLRGLWVIVAMLALVACDDDEPANVAGEYALNVVNESNGCALDLFNVGAAVNGIAFTVTQDGHDLVGTVGGRLLDPRLGSSDFEGWVDENEVEMTIVGDRGFSEGNCAFTYDATLRGTIDGDYMEGTIDYTRADNGNPDCETLSGCVTRQRFNAARTPSP